MKTDYNKQAEDFLARHNLEFRAVLVGNDCPGFCEDAANDNEMDKVDVYPRKTHIHGKHYRCTISGKGRGHVSFDFWNSYKDEEENYFRRNWMSLDNCYWDKYRILGKYPNAPQIKKPNSVTAYDLFACITKNGPGSFQDFCSEFGYSADSIRDSQIYDAVQREFAKVRKFFTEDELIELQEIN